MSTPVGSGNTIIVCTAFPVDFGSVTVSDTLGRAYVLVESRDGIDQGRRVCFASVGGPGGDDTITLTTTSTALADGASHVIEAYVFEYRNVAAIDGKLSEVGAITTDVDASWDAGSVTTTAASELVFAWVEDSNAAWLDPSFTTRSTFKANAVGDKVAPSAGPQSVTGTADGDWVVIAFSLKGM
jgi:hypothetical protein